MSFEPTDEQRYVLTADEKVVFSFSARAINTREELAGVLIDAANMLKSPSHEMVGECVECTTWILEGESHCTNCGTPA